MTTIERDFAIIFNQRIDRPERMVVGDWLAMWDRFENPVDYQEAFEAGVKSVNSEVEDLEGTIEDLMGEIRMSELALDSRWKEGYDEGFEDGIRATLDANT